MSKQKSGTAALALLALCLRPGLVGTAHCEEVLVKDVPYVVQKAHLD